MGDWIQLELLNGWVADEKDPPRYQKDGIQIHVAGAVLPTGDPELPVARFPEEIWPPFPQEDEIMRDGMVFGWRVETDGFLYIYRHHVLEFL